MTPEEREQSIRGASVTMNERFLLGLLDEARAKPAKRSRPYCGCAWCCAHMPPGTTQRGEAHHLCAAAKES